MVIASVSRGGDRMQLVDAGDSELQMASGLADVESLNGTPLGLDALSVLPSSSSSRSASCEEHEAPSPCRCRLCGAARPRSVLATSTATSVRLPRRRLQLRASMLTRLYPTRRSTRTHDVPREIPAICPKTKVHYSCRWSHCHH